MTFIHFHMLNMFANFESFVVDFTIVKNLVSNREKIDTLRASIVLCLKEHCTEVTQTHESSIYLSRMLTKSAEVSSIAERGRTVLRYASDSYVEVPAALAETLFI